MKKSKKLLAIFMTILMLIGMFSIMPEQVEASDWEECWSCGRMRSPDWLCDSCGCCGEESGTQCYYDNHCHSCGECLDSVVICPDCWTCENCANLCEVCHYCEDCNSDFEYCPGCNRCAYCYIAEGYAFCPGCNYCTECSGGDMCPECYQKCASCAELCPNCNLCEDCGIVHCVDCGQCAMCAGGDVCNGCNTCGDCSDRCESCVNVCTACGDVCVNCFLCEDCGEGICEGCGLCRECMGDYCEDCGYCIDCVDLLCNECWDHCNSCVDFCLDCDRCEYCADLCADCGNYCSDCVTMCEGCGTCENCAAICLYCESACSECADICVNCGEICDSCAAFCVDCGICEHCSAEGQLCIECNEYCSDCAAFCPYCLTCENCAGDMCPICDTCSDCAEAFCLGCGACSDCAFICDLCGGLHCDHCDSYCNSCGDLHGCEYHNHCVFCDDCYGCTAHIVCDVCGDHSYGFRMKNLGEKEGHQYKCSCGKHSSYNTGHSRFLRVIEEPTDTSPGRAEYYCDECGFVYDEEVIIPATGGEEHVHEYNLIFANPYFHYKGCICGNFSYLSHENHSFEWTIDKEATETENGLRHEKCEICGFSRPPEVIYADHEHEYSDKWSSDHSWHWHECSCGHIIEKEFHTMGPWEIIKEATETTPGMRKRACTVCSHAQESIIKAYAKDFDVVFDTMGGSEIPTQKVINSDVIYVPADPVKDNYIFAGWYADNKYEKTWDVLWPILQPTTLYAKWSLNTEGPPSIIIGELENIAVGEEYYKKLIASGTQPISWSIISGKLPEGLSISENGEITGTPAKVGSYKFTVKAENGTSPESIAEYTITVKRSEKIVTVIALDKNVYIDSEVPDISSPEKDEDYIVEGLEKGDELSTIPTLTYEVTPDTSEVGKVTIKIEGATAPENENYDYVVKHQNGELRIVKKASAAIMRYNATEDDTTADLDLTSEKVEEIKNKAIENEGIIDLSKAKDVTATEVSKSSLSSMQKSGLTTTVKLSSGSISMDKGVLGSILNQSTGNKIRLEIVEKSIEELNKLQGEAIKIGESIFDINIISGESKISTFDGEIRVEIPYKGKLPVAVWFLNSEGKRERIEATFEKNKVCFNLTHLSLYVIGQDLPVETLEEIKLPFSDVKESDWFYNAVAYVYKNKLMEGTAADLFSGNTQTSRSMIVTILHRQEGSVETKANNIFNDVEFGKWYSNGINWAAENKIVSGYQDGRFGHSDNLTREQLVTVLYNFAKFKGYDVTKTDDLKAFDDKDSIAEYAKPAMEWAVKAGIITGTGESKISPKAGATRAQVATILERFIGIYKD